MNEEDKNTLFGDSPDSDEDEPDRKDDTVSGDMQSSSYRAELMRKRPASCGVMAFHSGTEEALLLHVQREAERGNPASVLRAIDEFCYSRHWMMHCGDRKTQYLDKALRLARRENSVDIDTASEKQNLVCLEIGSYCGYSAVKIASSLGIEENEYLYCIENESKCVAYTQKMVDFAGLGNKVSVMLGSVSSSSELFQESGLKKILLERHKCDHFNVLFIDHDKARYLEDLQIIESNGLLEKGSIIVADNVLSFGQPLDAYLLHVRDAAENSLYSHSELHKCYLEYSNAEDYSLDADIASTNNEYIDGIEISVFR